MPSLVVSVGGKIVAHYPIAQQRTRIGRRPDNDIVLNSMSVSGDHAVLVHLDGRMAIEDRGSRNGTLVAGSRVTRRELDDGVAVRIGEYTLTLVADRAAMAYEPTMLVRPSLNSPSATLLCLDGPRAGQAVRLNKVVTTLGKPGLCVVTCVRRGADYAVMCTEGAGMARLNGAALADSPARLQSGDTLELGGSRLQFRIEAA